MHFDCTHLLYSLILLEQMITIAYCACRKIYQILQLQKINAMTIEAGVTEFLRRGFHAPHMMKK